VLKSQNGREKNVDNKMAFRQNIEKWNLKTPRHPLILKVFLCGTQFHPMHPQKRKHRATKPKGMLIKGEKPRSGIEKGQNVVEIGQNVTTLFTTTCNY